MIRRRIVRREVCILNRSVTRIPSLPEVGQANDLNNLIQTACHTRLGLNERREVLCEDFPHAGGHIAKVAIGLHQKCPRASIMDMNE